MQCPVNKCELLLQVDRIDRPSRPRLLRGEDGSILKWKRKSL